MYQFFCLVFENSFNGTVLIIRLTFKIFLYVSLYLLLIIEFFVLIDVFVKGYSLINHLRKIIIGHPAIGHAIEIDYIRWTFNFNICVFFLINRFFTSVGTSDEIIFTQLFVNVFVKRLGYLEIRLRHYCWLESIFTFLFAFHVTSYLNFILFFLLYNNEHFLFVIFDDLNSVLIIHDIFFNLVFWDQFLQLNNNLVENLIQRIILGFNLLRITHRLYTCINLIK